MRVHVTRSGDPGVCSAQPGNCPLSYDEGHYASPEEARLGEVLGIEVRASFG